MSYWIAQAMSNGRQLVIPGQFPTRQGAVRYVDRSFRIGPASVAKYSGAPGRCVDPKQPPARPVEVWQRIKGSWSRCARS